MTVPALGAGTIFGDLVWFVLGFFLYATAFAAAASLVSRQEEVGSATAPISVFLPAASRARVAGLTGGPLGSGARLVSFARMLM